MENGYWIICTESYVERGTQISKGSMKYLTTPRPVTSFASPNWREATKIEIETRQFGKGFWYNSNV